MSLQEDTKGYVSTAHRIAGPKEQELHTLCQYRTSRRPIAAQPTSVLDPHSLCQYRTPRSKRLAGVKTDSWYRRAPSQNRTPRSNRGGRSHHALQQYRTPHRQRVGRRQYPASRTQTVPHAIAVPDGS
eukprot:997796-Rhodomonas_salina.7